MKIGREPSSFKPKAHTPSTKPTDGLVRLSKQVAKAAARMPQAFTAGKLHFSKTLKSERNSEKITKLVHSRLKKVSYLRKK